MHVFAYKMHISCIFLHTRCISDACFSICIAYVCIFDAYLLHICCIFLHICCICLHIICIFLAYSCISDAYLCIFHAYSLHMIFELVFAYSLHMPAWRSTGGFFARAAPLPRLARQWLCWQHLRLGPSPQLEPQPSHPNNHPISPALRSCPPLAQRRRQPQLQQRPHTAQPARLSTPKPAAPWPPLSRARPASVQSFSPTHPAACRLSRALHELASRWRKEGARNNGPQAAGSPCQTA